MMLLTFPFIFAAAGSCANLLSSHAATVTAADIHEPIAIDDNPESEPQHERFHAREIASMAYSPSDALLTRPNGDTTTSEMPSTSLITPGIPSATSAPFPDVPYDHHSDGSAITLAIIVSIIGGALLLTLAGWAWRKQKNKKSFGPDHHDAELAKHKIINASGAPGGASRHYSRDMREAEARPYQRSPTAQRYVIQH
ncbi:uncharacterized protein CC84DRAFT_1176092 [Paraphaeosphaeria sporulosa]|uniref:Mid2 domain-containing protein n=1 Tax=Paraphaeosphaeria sporulosa TaxID=1460663 RepID=A0A177CEF1_9PLEO|nr:uncharacterized protein CC84DRAFT_1176092 [Paraphaeosphaeria sporulosa]OAG06013.1 hypothetical protein CC84DRAFT_1176092 [Paraphaeosphaeria sporulosa]